ncbi:MAG: Ig-like domain-containing protein, partial [Lactobacillus iners]|nr:Ig-like domain-containing protein [Lactobacillus iners]MCT7752832.1 Ig-like domain-containing protein [Lactobacillus iners]MCT7864149.1 Ig-like domain-containing protein [Lactobacillus iners]
PDDVKLTTGQDIKVTQTEPNKKPKVKTVQVVPSQADGLKKPQTKEWVDNPNSLTPTEKETVKGKVEEANKNGDQKPTVTVGANGETTVEFPDGSKATIPGNELVQEKGQSQEPNPVAPHTQSKKITGTGVAGAEIVVEFPGGKTAKGKVGDNGDFSITVPDDVKLTTGQDIKVTQTETNKKPTSKTVKVVGVIYRHGDPLVNEKPMFNYQTENPDYTVPNGEAPLGIHQTSQQKQTTDNLSQLEANQRVKAASRKKVLPNTGSHSSQTWGGWILTLGGLITLLAGKKRKKEDE